MSIRAIAAALVLAPVLAQANMQIDASSSISCNGELSISAGLNQPSNVFCSGDLSFSGTSLSSDDALFITAAHDLGFYGVSVMAPSLTFQAGGTLTIDAQSVLLSDDIKLSANALGIQGQINTVPEPNTLILMLAGMGALWWRSSSRRSSLGTRAASVLSAIIKVMGCIPSTSWQPNPDGLQRASRWLVTRRPS